MGFLNNILGQADGLFLAAIGWLVMDLGGLITPRSLRLLRDVIVVFGSVLILFGGSLTAYVGIGTWIKSGLNFISSSLVHITGAVLAIITLYLLVHTIRTLLARRKLDVRSHVLVFIFPIMCSLFAFGIFASISHGLQQPSVATQTWVNSQVGIS